MKTGYSSKSLIVRGRKIAYLEFGHKNEDVLLCIHGLTRNSHDFYYLATYMQDRFRVLSVDMAGHGDSDYLSDYAQYNYKLFLDDALEFLDVLGIKSVYWLGSSLGGIVGMFATERHPSLIRKLILNDIAPQMSPQSFASLQTVNIDSIRPLYSYQAYDDCKDRVLKMLSGFKLPDMDSLNHWLAHSIKFDDILGSYTVNFDVGVLSLFINTQNIMRKEGIWDIWKNIKIPVLEMWGRRSALVTAPIIEEMKKTNHHLTVCTCMSDGHVCNLIEECQLEFVRKWLLSPRHLGDIVLP